MDYFTYTYPKNIKNETKKIHHIVDDTPEIYKSTYQSRYLDGRPSDIFYFMPTMNIPKYEIDYQHQMSKSFIVPGEDGEIVKEIHKTDYSPHKFNENGIIREKYNYTLYENKNWTENLKIPYVEYEKIKVPKPKPKPMPAQKPKPKKMPSSKPKLVPLPKPKPMPLPKPKTISLPKPKPKPKPKIKPPPKIEKEFEIVNEEIEREDEKKKKYLKSNYIRKSDNIKKKKFKYKKKNYEKRNLFGKEDNYEYEENYIFNYDNKNKNGNENENEYDNDYYDGEGEGSEIKKIRKITEQTKINGEFSDLITTKKEYKLHKTSKIKTPIKNIYEE